MIQYNVTVKIEATIEEEWLKWMHEKHVPDVMRTGCFVSSAISKLKHPLDEDGITYSIQYRCPDADSFNNYMNDHAEALQRDHAERYKDRYVAFRTVLHEIHRFYPNQN